MFSLFGLLGSYYYIALIFQVLTIYHAFKTGRRQWIYLLIFLPAIGTLIYFFSELWPEIRRGTFGANFQRYIFPKQKINEWTRKVQISDNVTNKLGLSQAYAEQKQYDRAIELAKSCLYGLYADDPAIHLQLARQYFHNGQFKESLNHFDTLNGINKNRFGVMEDELMYVQAQDGLGMNDLADEGYRRVIRNHHSLEARYHYGLFLKKQQKKSEAREQFQVIREEIKLLPRYLRRRYGQWSRKALKELLASK
ncbi:tetratricopeptide repeat protein [Pedobacter sp. GR22-6]|uniref:tetratricopeptide repeat protein n=1 Tax=Pedobacter sp. GR22-6 TaxID=3127957 RepID=UPI00307D024C